MIDAKLPDIHSAWAHAYFSMLDDKPGAIDFYQRNIIHSFDNMLHAEKAVFDFDLGDIGLTPTKWSKFTGQYVDVKSLMAWVNNAKNVKTYDALWSFKLVPPNFTGKKAVHQWGNCLLGYSFRRKPKPVLTLYTRAQSLGFSGVADYALSDFVARKLSERIGIPQEDIALTVHCANFIIKMVEVVHYLTKVEKIDDYKDADTRIGESIRYYINYMDKDPDEIKWRAARRMSQKLAKVNAGIHRSFPVGTLPLRGWYAEKKIEKKYTSREASEFVLTGKLGTEPLEIEVEDEAV